MIEALEAKNLSTQSFIRHGFLTRKGGVSHGVFESLNCGLLTKDTPESLSSNMARVEEHFGIKSHGLVCCRQVHGGDVLRVDVPWALDNMPSADAMVTSQKGIALAIQTADCVPVLFADPTAGVIGAAHAGWRGAFGAVLENTITAMEDMGAKRKSILAAIGPCIWQDSYEVDLEFMDRFLDLDELNNRFFFEADTPDHFLFELPGYVRDKLRKMNIEDIALSPADTFADETRFYSFRRSSLKGEADTGRQLSLIMMIE